MSRPTAKLAGRYRAWVVVQLDERGGAYPFLFTTSGRRREAVKALEETWGEPWHILRPRHDLDCIKVTIS